MNDIAPVTYIIRTESDEYYCGFTNNLKERLKQHMKEKHPQWFGMNLRKNFNGIFIISGNFEKKIKLVGVKTIYNIVKNYRGLYHED